MTAPVASAAESLNPIVPGATICPQYPPGPDTDPDLPVDAAPIKADPTAAGSCHIMPTSSVVMVSAVHMSFAVPVVGVATYFAAGVVPPMIVDTSPYRATIMIRPPVTVNTVWVAFVGTVLAAPCVRQPTV